MIPEEHLNIAIEVVFVFNFVLGIDWDMEIRKCLRGVGMCILERYGEGKVKQGVQGDKVFEK